MCKKEYYTESYKNIHDYAYAPTSSALEIVKNSMVVIITILLFVIINIVFDTPKIYRFSKIIPV